MRKLAFVLFYSSCTAFNFREIAKESFVTSDLAPLFLAEPAHQEEQVEKEGKLLLQPLPTLIPSSSEETVREEIDAMAEKRKEMVEMKEQQLREEGRETGLTKNVAEPGSRLPSVFQGTIIICQVIIILF